jgi:PadR family transcriptional regulator, regulatory protein PadR
MEHPRRLLEHLLPTTTPAPPSLSTLEAVILGMLGNDERFGLQLVAESGGRLKRGTIYVTLGRMADKGFVSSRTEDRAPGAIGLPRRLYRATPLGASTLVAWKEIAHTLSLARVSP